MGEAGALFPRPQGMHFSRGRGLDLDEGVAEGVVAKEMIAIVGDPKAFLENGIGVGCGGMLEGVGGGGVIALLETDSIPGGRWRDGVGVAGF